MSRLAIVPTFVLILLLLADPLSARQSADSTGDPGFQVALLAGQAGVSGGVHRFLGGHAAFSGSRWGAAAHGLFGRGNGYASTLFSGGPTIRFPVHPRAELEFMIGAAYYGESLDTSGRAGSVFGPSGSALVRVPAGPVHLAAGFSGWYASYTDEIAVNPVPAEGIRFILGVGR